MADYEYKTVKVKANSAKALARMLNREGQDGWELVEQGRPKWAHTKIDVVLRRPKG